MELSISVIFGFLGALQGLTLAAAIATLGGDSRRPNRALSAILLVLSGTMFVVVLEHAQLTSAPIVLILIEYTLSLLYAPLLWRYVGIVLGQRRQTRLGLHFLPLLLWLLYLAAIGFGIVHGEDSQWRRLPPIMALVTYLVAYTIAAAVRVWRAREEERMLVTHGVALRYLIILMLTLHAAQVLRYIFRDVALLTNIVPVTGAFVVISMSALAFRQSRLFAGYETSSTRQKYDSSTLLPETASKIADRLVAIMANDKPFLNESLNAPELAARLSIPKAHLSQVLNSVLGVSVRDFINRYRVDEAVRLIKDPAMGHLTVEEIGYAAGFRSRSSFHNAFKRETNQTPAGMRAKLS